MTHAEIRTQIQAAMRAAFPQAEERVAQFYAMQQYQLGWRDTQLAPADVDPGKLLRPYLTLLACRAAGGDPHQALPLAAGIQLIHDFSLIHDDIEDNSDLRRGRPTVWKLWGLAQGINTGDGASKGRFEGDRLCKDLFRNLRAELWWKMRRRFEKTFQHVNGVQEFPIEELISIPNHGELISELSRPKVRFDEAGKILIESKKDMSGGSTNFADALLHAFAERRKFDLSRSIRLL